MHLIKTSVSVFFFLWHSCLIPNRFLGLLTTFSFQRKNLKTKTDQFPFVFFQFSVSQWGSVKLRHFLQFCIVLSCLWSQISRIYQEGDCCCKGLQHTDVNLMLKKWANHLCWDLLDLTVIWKFESIWGFVASVRELDDSILHWSLFTGYTGFTLMLMIYVWVMKLTAESAEVLQYSWLRRSWIQARWWY